MTYESKITAEWAREKRAKMDEAKVSGFLASLDKVIEEAVPDENFVRFDWGNLTDEGITAVEESLQDRGFSITRADDRDDNDDWLLSW